MPPPLPRNFGERHMMWWQPNYTGITLEDKDPMEPADHLDQTTQARVSLFPEMSDFLRSRFGLSRETDHQWFPVRPLGKGGFGGVAVWEKRDSLGNVVEETALKQSNWEMSLALENHQEIAREAAIMSQLNLISSEYIVYMKAFRCLREPEKEKATWRFYFEYCPYGDLGRLKSRYKAWGYVHLFLVPRVNADFLYSTYLPEEFLWRTFYSMAKVARLMRDAKLKELDMSATPTVPFVLIHSDIKPLNIFLGYHNNPTSPWHVYPVVKVGDFGLTALTNHLDPGNPQRFVKNGTSWYLPPESRAQKHREKYNEWEHPPFDVAGITGSEYDDAGGNPDYTNRKVDSSHNVWGFGLTMYELLTHQDAKAFSDHINALTEEEYYAWGQNTLPILATNKNPEYSYELRHLVRQCLNLEPSLRPTVEQILEVTRARVEEYEAKIASTNRRATDRVMHATDTYQLPKLFFKENEINDMPLGPHMQEFGRDDRYLALFAYDQDKYAAPVWGPIQHPNRARFARHYEELAAAKKRGKQNANGKRQRAEHEARQQRQIGAMDSIDQALLASGLRPESDEEPPRKVRPRRMRLWNDR